MSRVASICIGLLKAGALALFLALCGFGTASAHETGRHAASPAMITTPHHHITAIQGDCARRPAMVTAARPDRFKAATATDDCCQDSCACGCAAACASHFVTAWPSAMVLVLRVPAAVRLPGGMLDPAGLTTPPETRPPLSL